MITRTSGFGIIGRYAYYADNDTPPGMCVSYADGTYVQEFASKELLSAAFREQFPDEHREQFPEEYTD